MVRDLDLPVLNATDSRRLEVVVDGLPLFGGRSWQWTRRWYDPFTATVHLTMGLRTQRRDLPWGQTAQRAEIPRVGGTWQSRLVVLALDVGGRWSVVHIPAASLAEEG